MLLRAYYSPPADGCLGVSLKAQILGRIKESNSAWGVHQTTLQTLLDLLE